MKLERRKRKAQRKTEQDTSKIYAKGKKSQVRSTEGRYPTGVSGEVETLFSGQEYD
jgi:hypothetical protein